MNSQTDARSSRVRSVWFVLALAAIAWAGIVTVTSSSAVPVASDLAWAQGATSEEGNYTFFAFRRSLWRIDTTTSTMQFFNFPETSERDQAIVASRKFSFDLEEFPVDQVSFLASERNLTNYLWITNPTTGKALFVKARRDGIIEQSPILDQ